MSTRFTDTNGEEWDLALDAVCVQRVRNELGVDLVDLANEETWARLDTDIILQVNVLHCLLIDQCKERGVDAVGFARAIGPGDVRERAYNALLNAIELFSPLHTRSLWRSICQTSQQTRAAAMEAAVEKISDPALQQRLLAELKRKMDSAVETTLTRLRDATPTQDASGSGRTG